MFVHKRSFDEIYSRDIDVSTILFFFLLIFFFNSVCLLYVFVSTCANPYSSSLFLPVNASRTYFSPCHFPFSHAPCRRFSSPSSLHAHRLLRYSSLTLSLVLFSHSPHSHASPSTALTLPHASSFPFSRFSLHLFRPVSCPSFAFSLAPFPPNPSRTLPEAILHPSLRYRVNPSLLPAPHFSFYFTVDRDRLSRCRRRG